MNKQMSKQFCFIALFLLNFSAFAQQWEIGTFQYFGDYTETQLSNFSSIAFTSTYQNLRNYSDNTPGFYLSPARSVSTLPNEIFVLINAELRSRTLNNNNCFFIIATKTIFRTYGGFNHTAYYIYMRITNENSRQWKYIAYEVDTTML